VDSALAAGVDDRRSRGYGPRPRPAYNCVLIDTNRRVASPRRCCKARRAAAHRVVHAVWARPGRPAGHDHPVHRRRQAFAVMLETA